MITSSDLLPLPYTRDLTAGGIAYALRSLPYIYNRPGGSVYDRLCRLVASASVELAFRHYLSEQKIPFDIRGALPFTEHERYDVIVATNILVYYDAFEQALALANLASMLKPGGFFLTNYAVTPRPPMETTASETTAVFFDRQQNGDTIYAYQRR